MDPRPPQHPFTRPPERTLIHNPNHQSHQSPPQPAQSSPFAGYPPSTAAPQSHAQSQSQSQPQPQPPIHVPFSSDPYPSSRRDPFLPPSSQHARRSSYGVHGGDGVLQAPAPAPAQGERHAGWGNTARLHGPHHASHHQSSQSGPPPPPPSMSSSHTPAGQSPYGYEPPRRRSLGATSPPNPYGAPSHDPPPPPPSFTRQQMPPPSSPQQQHAHHASQPQRAPYLSAFGPGRELPGLGQAHRPGSSMSISSLIGGGEAGASGQTPQPQPQLQTQAQTQTQSSPPNNAPPSNNHSMQPPSPRRGLSSGSRSEFPSFRRQPSPERHMYGGGPSRAPEAHGYAAGSPTRSYNNRSSPEQGRQSLPQSTQPYKPMTFQGQRPYASSPNDAPSRDSRQSTASVPARPNSQPTGAPGPPEQEPRSMYEGLGGRRAVYGQPEERRRTLGESHHTRPNAAEILGAATQSASDRDRPVTVQPVSQSAFSPPRDQRGIPGIGQSQRGLWRHSAPEDAPRESTEGRREDPQALYRGYGGYAPQSQGHTSYGGHGAEDMVRGRSLDHLNHRVVEQYHAPPTSDPRAADRQKAEHLSRSLSSGGNAYPSRSLYDQPRRMGEEMQHSKSVLGNLGAEARRTGRASPLPQAVQGAQAQPLSIGKDPSIKSEFGRMFSGLGSGLGTSTPSRGSPMPQNGQESLPLGTDPNDPLRLQRVNSQNGRRPKRVKDEENAFDTESVDGRGTPSGSRGAKRNKHNHTGHHHHHHAHAHHHHHHHKGDEEIPLSTSSTPFNTKHSNIPPNGNPHPSHHHHHYHGTPHHHHHVPRASQPAPPLSPKLPPKTHDIQAVLDEAAKYPRRHLGSQLYNAQPGAAKLESILADQFGYMSSLKPLPRFELNPINCTFTIRVPRYYLAPRQRQQIVVQRHLWGARVYRDDSDPIAAAIHSGWIRGEWDETVDVSMLDPRLSAPNDPSDAEDTLSKAPAAPVTPPADMDVQIDILILPRIQEYYGTVEYGISSRKSRNHDGLSFMVHRLRWVEEGIGSRGQERTAAAMKQRLDASAALLILKNSRHDSLKAVNGTAQLHA